MAKLEVILAAHAGPGFGAGAVAVMSGLNKWQSPLELYLEKTLPPDEDGDDGGGSEAGEWGLDLEANVLRKAADVLGLPILGNDWGDEPCLFWPGERYPFSQDCPKFAEVVGDLEWLVTQTVHHPDLPLYTHPDGIVFREVLGTNSWEPCRTINAKTASAWVKGQWGEDESQGIYPPAYMVQNQAEILVLEAVTGLRLDGGLPVLIGGQEFRLNMMERDPELQAAIPPMVLEFDRRIREEDPPLATLDEAGERALKGMFPAEDPEAPALVAEFGTHLGNAALALREAVAQKKHWAQEFTAAKVAVQELMGEAPAMAGMGIKVSWRRSRDGTKVDWKGVGGAFEAVDVDAYEDAVGRYTEVKKGSRIFKPTLTAIEED